MMSSQPEPYGQPATRQRILDAAWELLEERGVGVRLADVAARAGVSRQSIYLHFGDRTGLFLAVGDHIDASLGRTRNREYVFGAPTSTESLRRWVELNSWYIAKIDLVSRIIEYGEGHDKGLAVIWHDRMTGRRGHVRRIAERLESEGQLAAGWTAEDAGDLIYAVTLPGPWRTMTGVLGWSQARWAERVTSQLERSILAETGSITSTIESTS